MFAPIHPGITKRSSWKKRASNPLNLNKASTPLVEPTHSRAVWRIRWFGVLDGDLQLFLKCLDLAAKMRFLILHRKGLQTTANTHQFNSVSWTHTLKCVLLGCSVLVLEADISQYSGCSHSLGNIQKQLQGETCFKPSESKQSFNSVSWTNTQQSSLEDTFV